MPMNFTFNSGEPGWLDVPDHSKNELQRVEAVDYFSGQTSQLWNLIRAVEYDQGDEHVFQIQNVHSGLVLDVESSEFRPTQPIIQYHATFNDNQLWYFERYDYEDAGSNWLAHPRGQPGLVMNVAGNGMIELQAWPGANHGTWAVQVGRMVAIEVGS